MRRSRKLEQRLIIAGVVVAVLAATGAAWVFRTPLIELIPTPPVVITEKDNGGVVNILKGQHVEVRLPVNRLSGGRWHVGIPVPYLEQRGDITFTEADNPAQPGDGTQTTPFVAVDKGSGPLFMGYLPDTDQNSMSPTKSFHVVVMVAE
jgi:predicted secreted protein